MRFWDSSALVPMLVNEPTSEAIMQLYELDSQVVTWWATEVECVSALTRMERDGSLASASMVEARRRLGAMSQSWQEVQPIGPVRETAIRLLRVHAIRAADAFQLAAAIAAAEDHPATLPFVTLDDRLAQAAEREGFTITRPDASEDTIS